MRDVIVTQLCRTLFVVAYADAHEEGLLPETLPRPGPGQEWMGYAPHDGCASKAGDALAVKIEELNDMPLDKLYELGCKEVEGDRHREIPTPVDFGHCLVMEALGSGVSWSDNHPNQGFKIPNIEAWLDYDPKTARFTMDTSGL